MTYDQWYRKGGCGEPGPVAGALRSIGFVLCTAIVLFAWLPPLLYRQDASKHATTYYGGPCGSKCAWGASSEAE